MSSAASVRSGSLRHRVQFMENRGTQSAGGATPEDWRPTGKPARCSVDPLSGGRVLLADQAKSRVTHVITMRYRSGIDPHWRIHWGQRVLEIERVIDVGERRRKLEIFAVERI